MPNFMMLSVPCLSISNPTVAELNPRLCPHTEILGRQEGCSPALLSGFPFLLKLPDVKGYDWLTFDQVNWYRQQSAAYKAKNGGQPLPALAFFHIPLPEYNEAASDENAILIGTRMEKACAPELNTGMFTAMKEAGDVMGMFVGHDHDNDYAVMWKGILLAYGRFTGGNTEYNHLSNGARVIVMKEGARTFTTWIRLKGGEIIDKTVYPDSYVKDDWRKRPLVTE